MANPIESQFVAALLATGDIATARRMNIAPSFFEDLTAQRALSYIYEYSEGAQTYGKVPALSALHARSIPFTGTYSPDSGTVLQMADTLKANQMRRLVVKLQGEVNAAVMQDPFEAYERIRAASADKDFISLVDTGVRTTFADAAERAVARYKASAHVKGLTGAPMPFPTLNKRLKGWNLGNLYTFFAPEKNYKTFVGLRCVSHLEKLKRRTAVISTEMSEEQLTQRLLCMELGLDFNRFLDGELDTDSVMVMEEALPIYKQRVASSIFYLFPGGTGAQALAEVTTFLSDINQDKQLAVALWDGQYRSADSDEWTDVASLTRGTKRLVMSEQTHKCPMILTTQEGSKEGQSSYRVYAQEADAHMRVRKIGQNLLTIASKALRAARDFMFQVAIDFSNSTMDEVAGSADAMANLEGKTY